MTTARINNQTLMARHAGRVHAFTRSATWFGMPNEWSPSCDPLMAYRSESLASTLDPVDCPDCLNARTEHGD